MEAICLLSCTSCGRIVDQWTMIPKCKRCGTNRFKQVNPGWFVLFCWFMNEPKHAFNLVVQDIKEKVSCQKNAQ